MSIKFRELSRIPIFGYETKKVSALGCHHRYHQILTKVQAAKGNTVYGSADSFIGSYAGQVSSAFYRIMSYIPVTGPFLGAIHLQQILKDKRFQKIDPNYKKCYRFKPHLFRSIIEMFGLGIVFLPIDIAVTLGRELKLKIFCKKLSVKKDVSSKHDVSSVTQSKKSSLSSSNSSDKMVMARETHELIFSYMEDIDDVRIYAQISKAHNFHAKNFLDKYSKMSQFTLNDYGNFRVIGTFEGAPLAVKVLMALQNIDCPYDNSKKIVETHDLRLMPKIEYQDATLSVVLYRLAQNWFKKGIYFSLAGNNNLPGIKEFDESYWVLVPKCDPLASIRLEKLIDLHGKNTLSKKHYIPSFKEAFFNLMIMCEVTKKPRIVDITCSEKVGNHRIRISSTQDQIQIFC